MTRACKLVEASFDPNDGGEIQIPDDAPSTPTFTGGAEEFDLGTVAGVEAYRASVDLFVKEVAIVDSEIEKFVEGCERAAEDGESAQTFAPFGGSESMNRLMNLAGFNRCDEVVILLRGDFDRLVHAANEDCACKFDSAGRCIHRGCGLTAADWAEVEVA